MSGSLVHINIELIYPINNETIKFRCMLTTIGSAKTHELISILNLPYFGGLLVGTRKMVFFVSSYVDRMIYDWLIMSLV